MGLNPDPLLRIILAVFLCILVIPLVVLVFWGLVFLYQKEPSPKVVDSSKYFGAQIPYFLSKFETHFYSYSPSHTLSHSLQPL